MEIFTIGHSTLEMKEFIRLLKLYGIETVIDVRRFPGSRKFPHFSRENLKKELENAGIKYVWLGELLGGYRKGGYRNYMTTDSFKKGIEELLNKVQGKTAIMCAEKLWFRCHRRFIAEELVRRGHRILHIVDERRVYEHRP